MHHLCGLKGLFAFGAAEELYTQICTYIYDCMWALLVNTSAFVFVKIAAVSQQVNVQLARDLTILEFMTIWDLVRFCVDMFSILHTFG